MTAHVLMIIVCHHDPIRIRPYVINTCRPRARTGNGPIFLRRSNWKIPRCAAGVFVPLFSSPCSELDLSLRTSTVGGAVSQEIG